MGDVESGDDAGQDGRGAGAGAQAGDPRFGLEVTREGPRVVFALAEELDPHTAPQLRAAVDALDETTDELVLDLSAITFIDSSGLREILRVHETFSSGGRRVVLRSPSRTAHRLLEISGLLDLLNFE